MKAIVCERFGAVSDLQLVDVPTPKPAAGEARVAIHAAGVNYADALKVEGRYQVKPTLPWTPGVEAAGTVVEVGPDVRSLTPGQRVMVVPGERAGGFAEEIVLPESRLLPLPPALSFEQAATLPVVFGTAMYALRQRATLAQGETLLVLGAAGGVGLATVTLGRALGATVIAAASSEEKRRIALEHGATHVVDYTQPNWSSQVLAALGGRRVDVVFDPVGDAAFEEAERCIGWNGRYLVVGFAGGSIPQLSVNRPLVKGYSVCGVRFDVWRDRSWSEARANYADLLDLCARGLVQPVVSARFPLERVSDAIRSLVGRASTGKVIVEVGGCD